MTMPGELHVLQTVDGSRVRYRRWLPDSDLRATVQLVHGASEHSGRYDQLAARLARRGFGVWAMDLRGHGRTAESTGSAGSAAASAWRRCCTTSTPCTW